MARTTPKIAPSSWGSAPPSNTWFRGPTRVFMQNGMSIGSATFAQHTVVSHSCTMGRYVFPWKLPLSLVGSDPQSNIWYLGHTRVINPNGILTGSTVLVWVQMLCHTTHSQWGRKTPKIAPSPWDCITLPEDRATAICNMHKKFVNDRACGSGDMLANRQTHRQTDMTESHKTWHNFVQRY